MNLLFFITFIFYFFYYFLNKEKTGLVQSNIQYSTMRYYF